MSIGPLGGVPASAAGAPLSQTKGPEIERTQQDSAGRQRQIDSSEKAERASGIGQTSEDQQASERDADGRRLWERNNDQPTTDEPPTDDGPKQPAKDPRGESGGTLDVTA